ncbi:membrane fusion protein [Vibrio crassostreae]|uniref:HlyD family secretion protein n=1 Tax=Vibrio crassostreae TaxID=246167 RepID=UPI0005DD00A3|nr:HlyD family efflux transporter periplasmic adaptor subunit [Vibrio crassostreae]TCL15475.1 membrane fusion protein [Vibrio crassostreae]CAK1809381.1 membrane fusion protein [Vibrio crassostreae]CAK1944412.1 membrane fusion protein [Vibrio crassostreae]CAK1949761.1 membrane fusion protein [Vibrio crassostreae]CAK1953653.1 membrane fusion protein [Vibrio crassostreae]
MLSRAKYLYRTEYFEAQKNTNNGTILIQSSLNQNIYLSFSILVLIAIIAFVIFAEYTRRETLVGVVSPIGGMVKVKSNDSGYIDNLFVKEGDKVNRLTPLYEIKTERFDGFGVGVKKRILASIEKQHQLLIERKLQESNKAAFENDALTRDLNRLETEVGILNNVLKLSHQELKLAKNLINQQKTLLDKNFVSELDYQKQQLDFLSKQSNAENQNLNLQRLLREKQNLITNRQNLDINLAITLKDLDSRIETTIQNKVEFLSQSDSQVRSPTKGIVTSILAEEGHSVSNGQALLIIAPESNNTFVELYASSRNIGFLKVGQKVRLRFDAFPYEKFGTQNGIINSISKSAVPPEMIDNQRLIKKDVIEGLYQIRVKLSKPTITVYGKEEPLISGMTVIADVELDSRKIYEWILEPLYTIKGKI